MRKNIKKWSKQETLLLEKIYKNSTKDELKLAFPLRNLKSINRKAEEMSLKKTKETLFRGQSIATKRKWDTGKFDRELASKILKNVIKNRNQFGHRNPNWKGNKVKKDRNRTSWIYKTWRELIFKRDDYVCQLCFKRGGNLHAHHIRLYSECKDLRFEVANGITLCSKCHKSIRRKEAYYQEQFVNYVKNMKNEIIKVIPVIVKKGWGQEEIFCSYPELGFCGKYLIYKKSGAISSLHWHRDKSEVFKIESGKFKLRYIKTDNADEEIIYLNVGDAIFVPPNCPHQLTCLEPGKILEVSSADKPEDNFRCEKGDSQLK